MRPQGTRDELAIKVAVAATLPGVDPAAAIQSQRSASLRQLEALQTQRRAHRDVDAPEGLAWSLVADSMIFAAEAEIRWLDHAAQRLGAHPRHAMTLELTADRPKRGRPTKAETATADAIAAS